MACSKCKQKKNMDNGGEFINKWVIWGLIVWLLFGVYGFYNLISKFI